MSRAEFDEVFDRLVGSGLPMKRDRDDAWRHFQGWRVNYDEVLVALAALVQAPYAPWSSDRGKLRPAAGEGVPGPGRGRV